MRNSLIIAGVAVVLLLGASWWSRILKDKQLENDGVDPAQLITRSGLHWHPHLEIHVKGIKQDIPGNIGVGPQYGHLPTFEPSMGMTAMHTHESDGVIHLEFPGIALRDDTKLGVFFKIWGKDMLEFGPLAGVTINGVENTDSLNYEMKDGDKIVLRYN